MDFLKNSPLGYALTASPIIYAEIVEEMWSKAYCTTRDEIKFRIKGKSYTLTSSVINEALQLPDSNFENMPTNDEIQSMLTAINYASSPCKFSEINKKFFRKEWSHFFDTLNRVFAGKSSWLEMINTFVLKIAYSLMYGRRIDIGGLLLKEFSNKLDKMENRSKVIYYARFFMIIANHLCKELSIEDRDDTLEVCMQQKNLFSHLVTHNRHAEVEFVLPQHIQVQLSTLHYFSVPPKMPVREESTSTAQVELQAQSLSRKIATSSVPQSGKRKRTALHSITDGNDGGSKENGTAIEVQLPQKKKDANKVKAARNLLVVDQEMLPAESNNALLALETPLLSEEKKPKRDLVFPHELAVEPKDRQHLMNAASVLKSQLVARLTTNANILSNEDMIIRAHKCYNTLRNLGDNSFCFMTEVNKLIAQHRELTLAAEKKENLNGRDRKERYVQQSELLCDATKKLSSAQCTLLRMKSDAASLNLKIEELTSESRKLKEELSRERERVNLLTAERDECKEAMAAVESELGKLNIENEAACMAFEAINARYYVDKKEFEEMSNQLLRSCKKMSSTTMQRSSFKEENTIDVSSNENEDHLPKKCLIARPNKKKMNKSFQETPSRTAGHEFLVGEIRDWVLVVKLPSSPEEEKLKCDHLCLVEPELKPEDRQHLQDAASVCKSTLVAHLESCAHHMSYKDMDLLASKCYSTLGELQDDYTSFHIEVSKLIAQHRKVESAAKDRENFKEWDGKAHYIHQVEVLSELRQKLSGAQKELSESETK